MFTISRDNLFNILCFHNGLIRMRFVADLMTSCNGITHTFYKLPDQVESRNRVESVTLESTSGGIALDDPGEIDAEAGYQDRVESVIFESRNSGIALDDPGEIDAEAGYQNRVESVIFESRNSGIALDDPGEIDAEAGYQNRVESVIFESRNSGIALVDSRSVGASVFHDSLDRVESLMDENFDRRISDPALVDNPEADPQADTMRVRDDAFYESYTSVHTLARRVLADIVSFLASRERRGSAFRLREIHSTATIDVDSGSDEGEMC